MFLLFSGDQFYPCGGFGDFMGSFDSLEDAKRKHDEGDEDGDHYSWGHVVDSKNFQIIAKCWEGDWKANAGSEPQKQQENNV